MSHEPDRTYWDTVVKRGREIDSDGCTGGLAAHRECCLEHDIHYRTHRTVAGLPIGKDDADRRFLHCMQRRSWLGWWSPFAWIRYAAVRLLGGRAWTGTK